MAPCAAPRAAVLLLLLALGAVALQELPHRVRGGEAFRLWQEREHRSLGDVAAQELTFDAYLDNNNPSLGTFPNRYVVATEFAKPDPGYCFFLMGGEGPMGGLGSGGLVGSLAQKHGALMVGIEHRFYGSSVPNQDLSTKNLQYLTSRQALADAARLITLLSKTHQCKWFTFGGSYSGALSAWFRELYPNLTHGSLSSSGVVNAIYEFPEFDEQVALAIGGTCASNVRKLTAAMDAEVSAGNLAKLIALFNGEPSMTEGDFFYMAADSAAMADQYGSKEALCTAMAEASSAGNLIEGFANFTKKFWGPNFGANCFYNTQCLKTEQAKWQPTSRAWRWQKCNELAYFQVAPKTNSLRSQAVSLAYHNEQCETVFGKLNTQGNVADTNVFYGGARPNATQIFYSDFSDDPWQRASVQEAPVAGSKYTLVTCDGCGHCRDLGSSMPSDPPSLTKEREDFEAAMLSWLA